MDYEAADPVGGTSAVAVDNEVADTVDGEAANTVDDTSARSQSIISATPAGSKPEAASTRSGKRR